VQKNDGAGMNPFQDGLRKTADPPISKVARAATEGDAVEALPP
jgi:hypothetical protein